MQKVFWTQGAKVSQESFAPPKPYFAPVQLSFAPVQVAFGALGPKDLLHPLLTTRLGIFHFRAAVAGPLGRNTVSGKRTHWASLIFAANSVSSAKNSVSSLWHTNNSVASWVPWMEPRKVKESECRVRNLTQRTVPSSLVTQDPELGGREGKKGQAGKAGGEPQRPATRVGAFVSQRPPPFCPTFLGQAHLELEPAQQYATQAYDTALGGIIPFGMIPPRGGKSIYTSQKGIQGKEGECGGWIYGIKHPKSNTPPQSPCSPCRSWRRDKPQCRKRH